MKTTLTALLAICLCWAVGCGEFNKGFKKGLDRQKKVEAAEDGDPVAQYYLGWMYDKGKGVPKDYKEAVKWFRKSAEQDYALAQFNLGLMCRKGEGVPKDDKESVKWYRKSAEQGFPQAQTNLGFMYVNGQGVLQDDVTAYAWFNIAAINAETNAKENKGILSKKMTADQIAKAEQLSREMVKKNPKLLNK